MNITVLDCFRGLESLVRPLTPSFLISPFNFDVPRIPNPIMLSTGICECEGVLACLDGYMNIAMEQTEEYVDGQLKAKYGDCFIRGNNVLYISAARK